MTLYKRLFATQHLLREDIWMIQMALNCGLYNLHTFLWTMKMAAIKRRQKDVLTKHASWRTLFKSSWENVHTPGIWKSLKSLWKSKAGVELRPYRLFLSAKYLHFELATLLQNFSIQISSDKFERGLWKITLDWAIFYQYFIWIILDLKNYQ